MENNNLLTLQHIGLQFAAEPGVKALSVLGDISLSIRAGEFVSLIGPSGSGKSTVLRIIAGFLKPTKGSVENKALMMAMVFQNFALFPWLTVIQNIEFGLQMRGVDEGRRRRIAYEKIADVKLSGFEHVYPRELSGGMRQRVGIARALAMAPDLLLMDEPFSALDELTAERLRKDLLLVWEKYKMTVLMVTHLVEEAVELSDRVLILSRTPAVIKKHIEVTLPRQRNKRTTEYFTLVDAVAHEIDQ